MIRSCPVVNLSADEGERDKNKTGANISLYTVAEIEDLIPVLQ